ncbi:DDB1- and CUL4-associated factor 13-like [Rhopilema esculentum]|uniref:DDB1- and CUL4-associated factor 13-like n=1 Tax=Rhopilema esculentum TaxID=499914 RepID=UPI0031CEB419|eukprot:gene2598-795_t
MKVKVLSRNPSDYVRERTSDINKVPRNLDPSLHPFEAPREYTLASNAAKLERVFAKPFVGSLEGHTDGVNCLSRNPRSLSLLVSGSCDGVIKMWNLPRREELVSINAHSGFVRGLCFNPKGDSFFSIGDDKIIKQWNNTDFGSISEPQNTIIHKTLLTGIDHHWVEDKFATCGEQVEIWDESKAVPIRNFSWGLDTITSLKFNCVETHILGATSSDRGVFLCDIRGGSPLRKVVMKMKSNAIAWNPMEAYIFSIANEDSNVYTFDMRRLNMPVNVHMDHVAAVLDVDYAPTGQEMVTGSFDKTIRIFPRDQGHSREVYHTKRMQRVFCVKFSSDSKFVLSGSDETNIRIWKANASEQLGPLAPRQRAAISYNDKLKEKFQHHPKIKRILRHRHVPAMVYKASKQKREEIKSARRKQRNVELHSKPGTFKHVPERKKNVVSIQK